VTVVTGIGLEVESLCPAPRYAELFQRTAREAWDGHSDEVRRESTP
jgi:hypothetical protein